MDTREGFIVRARDSIIPVVVTVCMVILVLSAVSCGKPTKPSTQKTTAKKPTGLVVVNSWWVDNQTHQEPMQVAGVTSSSADTLFVALIASDSGQGPERGGPPMDGKVQSVEGGGLTWIRRAEAHLSITGTPSIAEIWTAFSARPVAPFTVTVTRDNDNGAVTYCSNYQGGSGPSIANGMVLVQAITGADRKNPIGATAVVGVGEISGRMGPASVTLTTTRAGSLVEAVGADWSDPIPRLLPAGQVLLHENVSTPNGDDYWAQGLPGPVATPGPVTLSVTAPADDNCNMAAVEILRAP